MVVRRSALVGLVVLGLLGIPAPASAAPGDVNTRFGNNGTVFEGGGRSFDIATRVSGKVVTGLNGEGDIIVAKRFPRGALDPTFGTNGRVGLQYYGMITDGVVITHDSVENILVGATITNGLDTWMATARLTSDGALDTSYSADGWILDPTPGTTYMRDVLATSTGAVVLLGQQKVDADTFTVRLARTLNNGMPDVTFGVNGRAQPYTFNNANVVIDSIVESGDGYIVGVSVGNSTYLMRVAGNGVLDTTFGDAGFTRLRFGSSAVSIVEIARRANGSVMAAVNLAGTSERLGVAVVRPNGQLDTRFSGDGRAVLPLSSVQQEMVDMAVAADGKVYVTGVRRLRIGGQWQFRGFVAALLRSGALDMSFSGDGVAGFDMGPEPELTVAGISAGTVIGSPLYVNGSEYNVDLAMVRTRIVSVLTS